MRLGDPETYLGLTHGAVIQNPLYYPDQQGERLITRQTRGGAWRGYDFNRPEVFSKGSDKPPIRLYYAGQLWAFVPPAIEGNPPDVRTPIAVSARLLYDMDVLATLDAYSTETLVGLGLLAVESYRETFRRVGVYERYAAELEARSLSDDPVYQVTPKGNTLVFLLGDGGDPAPRRNLISAFSVLGVPRPEPA